MRRRGPQPRTVLAIASMGAGMAFVDATIVNIAFPDIARSYPHASIAALSWVLNAYNIVFAAFLVAAGRLADLVGRRRVFISGLELFTVASVLCAVAPSHGTLTAFRVLQALGAALLVPSSLALVLDAFPAERRSHGVALLSAVAAAAAGLGPSLGGLLIAVGDWRLVFLVNVPIGVATVVLARRHLVESRDGAGSIRGCWAHSPRRSCSEGSSPGAARRIARRSSTSCCCATGRSASPTR